MLASAHKHLLLNLARSHAAQVRESLLLARSTLGEHHPNVGRLHDEVQLADACVHDLTTEPTRAARAA